MQSFSRHLFGAALTVAALAMVSGPLHADKPFYKGKRVTMLINYGPGGGSDRSGRVIARHLPRLLEGNPKIVVKNMPGAGGLKATNYMGEVAKPDGLTVTNFSGGYTFQLLKDPALRVDLRKNEWIAGVGGTSIVYARTDTKPGLKKPTDIWKITDPSHFKVAGFRINNSKDLRERLAFRLLEVKHQPVTGFRGTTKARTALMQNEVQAFGDSRAAWFKTIKPNLIDTGTAIGIYHYDRFDKMGRPSRYDDIDSSIPSLSELYQMKFGKAPDSMEWHAIAMVQKLQGSMVRNTSLAPGSPKAAIMAMREAYGKLANDEAYKADAMKSLGFVPQFVNGETVEQLLDEAFTKNTEVQEWLIEQVNMWKSKSS